MGTVGASGGIKAALDMAVFLVRDQGKTVSCPDYSPVPAARRKNCHKNVMQ
jgi:hypothetical protein